MIEGKTLRSNIAMQKIGYDRLPALAAELVSREIQM